MEVNKEGNLFYFHDLKIWFSFEASNGINAQESGTPLKISADEEAEQVYGSYSYISPEGTPVIIAYEADQNGFRPQGNVIPTPPPVPEAIQKSLEFNERNPQPQKP